MNIKYVPRKTQQHPLIHSNENTTNNIPVCILHIKSVSVAPPFASIRSSFLLGIELLISSRTFGPTLYHASQTRLYISSFKQGS